MKRSRGHESMPAARELLMAALHGDLSKLKTYEGLEDNELKYFNSNTGEEGTSYSEIIISDPTTRYSLVAELFTNSLRPEEKSTISLRLMDKYLAIQRNSSIFYYQDGSHSSYSLITARVDVGIDIKLKKFTTASTLTEEVKSEIVSEYRKAVQEKYGQLSEESQCAEKFSKLISSEQAHLQEKKPTP